MTRDEDRHPFYIRLAYDLRKLSKCQRASYGSVLVSADHRICSTGINGKPRGSINDHICYRLGLEDNSVLRSNCCIHSEINCILQSHVTDRPGATLYVSGIPCTDCALVIMQSGISTLVMCRLVDSDMNLIGEHQGNSNLAFYRKYGVKLKLYTYLVYDPDGPGFSATLLTREVIS